MTSLNYRLTNFGSSDPFHGCQLVPFNGNKITINGVDQTIPWGITNFTGGIQVAYNTPSTYTIDKIANQQLVTGTTYYVYAWMNAGVMALDFSTTGWQIKNPDGYPVNSSDDARTLVGMLYTSTSGGQIVTRGNARQETLTSRENSIKWECIAWPTGNSSGTLGDNQIQWMEWSDYLPQNVKFQAEVQNNTANSLSSLTVSINGGSSFSPRVQAYQSNAYLTLFSLGYNPGGEGLFTAIASVIAGSGTASINSGVMYIESAEV